MLRNLFIACILVCNVKLLVAQSIILSNSKHEVIDITSMAYIFVDTSQQLSFQDVQQTDQKHFVQNRSGNINHGMNKVVWLKLIVQGEPGEYLLEVREGQLVDLKFFYPGRDGRYQTMVRDDYRKRTLKATNLLFPIQLHHHQPQVFYLRCYSVGAVWVPLSIGTKDAFLTKNHWDDLFQGVVFGCLIITLLYNTFIFAMTRDLSYLYYILYLATFIIYISMLTGHSTEFLWPKYPDWGRKNFLLFGPLFCFLMIFTNYFLNTKVHAPNYRKISYVLAGMSIPIGFIGLYSQALSETLQHVFVPTASLFMLLLGIVVVKKFSLAKLYLLGWSAIIISAILVTMYYNGTMKFSFHPIYLVELGALFEVLIFSLALANRIKYYQQENDRLMTKQNEILAQKVNEKTKELQNANNELLASNEELQQSQEEIAAQRDAIESKNLLVAKSIKAARHIQEAALPFEHQINCLLSEYFILYHPRDIVSGDFYWIEQVNDKVFVIALDCTGHGVPGAFMSMIANTLLDNIIKVNKVLQPAQVLNSLHEQVQIGLRQETTNDKSGMDVALLVLEASQNQKTRVQFAGARRPLYYIIPGEPGLNIIKESRRSIGGIQPTNVKFENQHLNLPKGSIVYLGSDGYEDQNNESRKKLGTKKLQELLLTNAHLPLWSQKEQLEKTLDAHMRNTDQRDDILLIGIKLSGNEGKVKNASGNNQMVIN